MTAFVYSNFAKAYLNFVAEAIDTTLYVDEPDTHAFAQPVGGQVQRCTISDDTQETEIIDITANPKNGTLTVVRALEGTAARRWPAGSKLQPVISAGILAELEALKP